MTGDQHPKSCSARKLAIAATLFAAIIAAYTVQSLIFPRSGAVFFTNWVQNGLVFGAAVLATVGALRLRGLLRIGWLLVAATLWLWAIANFLWTIIFNPIPLASIPDAIRLLGYISIYGGVIVLLRARTQRARMALWRDGLIGALGGSALIVLLISSLFGMPTELGVGSATLVDFGYPIADTMTIALVFASATLTRGRIGLPLGILTAAVVINTVGDVLFTAGVVKVNADGSSIADVIWSGAEMLMAFGPWIERPYIRTPVARTISRRTLIAPAIFSTVAIAVLVASTFLAIPSAAMMFAIATLMIVIVGAGILFTENLSMSEERNRRRVDDMTGLLTRDAFFDDLTIQLKRRSATTEHQAVMIIDLDRFREINDTFGYLVGNDLLHAIADRFKAGLPDVTLARLDGDTFALTVELAAGVDPVVFGRAVMSVLATPITVGDIPIYVTGSAGVALYPADGEDFKDLMRAAGDALLEAKRRRTEVERYIPALVEKKGPMLSVTELHEALEQDQIILYYQPKCSLTNGDMVGVEALVRWAHPQRGLLFPDSFIELAEQHGLMRRLTLRVTELALKQQVIWSAEGLDLSIAVNVSPGSLLDTRFIDDIAELIGRYRPQPGMLQIEITEDTMMIDPDRAVAALARLGTLGVTFALDDFGTGYSSLAQLKQLPLSCVKIDRSFVIDMLDSDEDEVIVRTIIKLGQSLGLGVVAEGVETTEHWNRLAELECSIAQGYLLSRPMPPESVPAWAAEHMAIVNVGI